MEMPAPPISISFAARAALAFVRQVRGLTAARYRPGKSVKKGRTPFSEILVADIDQIRRTVCVERLRRAGARVRELNGSAIEAAKETITSVDQYGLHFAFLDPYNLGELDFSIIQTLLQLKRIDMLIHVSAMDLQRNLERNVASVGGAFDRFARGCRVLLASMLRNPKSAVLCSSTGAIRSPNLVRGRPPTLNLLPQKKTRGCTGFFWPPNISLRANLGVWPLMYISKANCFYNTYTHARRLPLTKPPP